MSKQGFHCIVITAMISIHCTQSLRLTGLIVFSKKKRFFQDILSEKFNENVIEQYFYLVQGNCILLTRRQALINI